MTAPAVELLESIGYRCLVLDRNPAAPAGRKASRFLQADFGQVDAARAALAGIEVAGIIATNDFGVRTAAALVTERKLPGYSPAMARALTNKALMKGVVWKAGIPTAPFVVARKSDVLEGRLPAWSAFPCVVKPAHSGGGSRGVGVAHAPRDIVDIVERDAACYLDEEVIVERFISGTEHTVETLVVDCEPHVLSISDKENYPGNATIVQNLYFPGPVGNRYREAIVRIVRSLCRALELTRGTLHMEVIVQDGQPYFIEVGGRPGGGINWHPICRLSTGYEYPRLLAECLTGRTPQFDRGAAHHLAWHYFPKREGIVRSVTGFEELAAHADVVACELYEVMGQPARDLRNDLARPGFVLVAGPTHEAARARAEALCAQVSIDVVPDERALQP
jgi:biotin carboxylase